MQTTSSAARRRAPATLISGNNDDGIVLAANSDGNQILGNLIGTDVTGTVDLGNNNTGVHFTSGSDNNVLGGTTAAARNVIGGNNQNGVAIQFFSTGNVVAGNYIGTDVTGDADLGNQFNGVRITTGANNNTIGGSAAGSGNVISGNDQNGIQITDAGDDRTGEIIVQGNTIGLNASGTVALANSRNGVLLEDGVTGNLIGTDNDGADDAAERNVISGNTLAGVRVSDTTSGVNQSHSNVIAGNYIGTDVTGAIPVGNAVGVEAADASATIGGVTGAQNVISGNLGDGVNLTGIGSEFPEGTTHWYKGDGDALNLVGNYQNGALQNGVTYAAGKSGQAFQFSSPPFAVNSDQVLVADSSSLDLTTLTIDVWVSLDVLPTPAASSTIVEKGTALTAENYGLVIAQGSGGLGEVQFVWYDGSQFRKVISSGANITAGTFYHVAATADGSTVRLFLDGQLIHEEAQLAPLIPNNGPLYIGSNEGSGFGNRFEGRIDELAIHNTALTPAAIERIYRIGGAAKASSTVSGNLIGTTANGEETLDGTLAWWSGEGDATSQLDGSAGTVVGGTSYVPGLVGQAFAFDGTSGYVDVPDTDDSLDTGTLVSAELWFNTDDPLSLEAFLTHGFDNVDGKTWAVGTDSDGKLFASIRGTVAGFEDVKGTTVLAADTWYHAAFTYDGSVGRLYLNGQLEGSATTTINVDGDSRVVIGGFQNPSNSSFNYFPGEVDEPALYGRVLSPGEVRAIYSSGAQGKAIGNDAHGVFLDDSPANIVGTNSDGQDDATEGNVIAGNAEYGVEVDGQSFTGNDNVIAGNTIGLQPDGMTPLGNASGGVHIVHSARTRVGSDGDALSDSEERNLISGNNGPGVYIHGHFASFNLVAGNYIGTDITGDVAAGNASRGVLIENANDNRIGGGRPGMGNVISANGGGVFLHNISGHGKRNRIQGNFIGLNADGDAAIGSGSDGVYSAVPSGANIIGIDGDGVDDAGEGNVISANFGNGVYLAVGSGEIVAGNLIGTDATGTFAFANGHHGIRVRTSGNRIGTDSDGTSDALEGNVISGNTETGIFLNGGVSDTTIAGNTIGTTASGLAALPNRAGILVDGPFAFTNNTIGGFGPDAGNLISGNNGPAISMTRISGTQIVGNWIGVDATGDGLLINGDLSPGGGFGGGTLHWGPTGVYLSSAGTSDIINNVISGHNQNLVVIGSGGQTIQGNYIGTNTDGDTGLGGGIGINLANNSYSVVGGGLPGQGNVLSGLTSTGLLLYGGNNAPASNHIVQGNMIGVDVTGTAVIGNGRDGITLQSVQNPVANNVIGTDGDGVNDAAERNVISGHAQNGIALLGANASNNTIAGNFIGTDVTGAVRLGNTQNGILVEGSGNRIGTDGDGVADLAERNVISGNTGDGVQLNNAGLAASASLWLRADGDATDASPQANDGALLNGIGFGPGRTGQAFDFQTPTTFGSNPHTVEVPDDPSLDATAVTVAAWVNVDTLSASWVVAHKGKSANTSNYELGVGPDGGGGAEIGLGWYNGGTFYSVSIPAPGFVVGEFHHVAATADGTTVSIYLDGVLIGQGVQTTPLVPNNDPLQLGSFFPHGNRMDGRIDELVIFNRALNATEIESIYDTGGNGLGGGTTVAGNYIGTNAAGTVALGNANGVVIQNGSAHQTIGTDGDGVGDAAEGNVISGSAPGYGVYISGSGTDFNTVAGNLIGTDATGTYTVMNSVDGVTIRDSAANNTIGGNTVDERNVISGNLRHGVYITGNTNQVAGNYIGTNSSGTAAVPNSSGVVLEGAGNTVGVAAVGAEGNVISGNNSVGVLITAEAANNNTVAGNLIGTDATGNVALGNDANGVLVQNGPDGTIIGTKRRRHRRCIRRQRDFGQRSPKLLRRCSDLRGQRLHHRRREHGRHERPWDGRTGERTRRGARVERTVWSDHRRCRNCRTQFDLGQCRVRRVHRGHCDQRQRGFGQFDWHGRGGNIGAGQWVRRIADRSGRCRQLRRRDAARTARRQSRHP